MAAPNRPTTIKTKEGPPLVVAPVEELVTNAAAVAAAFDAALSTFGSFVFNLQHGGLHVTSLLHHKKKKGSRGMERQTLKFYGWPQPDNQFSICTYSTDEHLLLEHTERTISIHSKYRREKGNGLGPGEGYNPNYR